LDEGISAGDGNFQAKSSKKIGDFFKQKKTVIIVSHWLDYLKSHCQRIIWLDKGQVVGDGRADLIKTYEKNKG
jgi:teichoic acid transport system ATP-binding protein